MAKILVIEDDQDVAVLLTKKLSLLGYEVATAFDAIQGRSFMLKEHPSLVILDLLLPAGGGLKILEYIRSSDMHKNIPVIIVTAANSEKIRQQALSLGATAYLEKPYEFDDLKTLMQQLLNGGTAP